MTKHISSILLVVCICIFAQAQTPYDSFAPHISRPILDVEAVSSHKAASHISQDTIFYKSVIDPHQGLILLTDVSSGKIIAYVPITDEIHKWLSPDPLLDKYPGISPYAYCNCTGMKTKCTMVGWWIEGVSGFVISELRGVCAWCGFKTKRTISLIYLN